jgi:hypothetical protein
MRHMHHFYEASENNLHSRIGRGFPLFTELPRRCVLGKSGLPAYGALGNRAFEERSSRKLGEAKGMKGGPRLSSRFRPRPTPSKEKDGWRVAHLSHFL